MGGSQSQEFMVYTDAGEDLIASCPVCGYAANLEKATSRLEPVIEMEPTGDGKAGARAHAGLRCHRRCGRVFQNLSCHRHQVRGLHGAQARRQRRKPRDTWHGVARSCAATTQVNETKLLGAIGAAELRPMQAEELEKYFHGPAGYLGPVGLEATE